MALSAVQLQSMIDTLYTALGSGALSVRHGDRQVTYRSSDEIKAGIAQLEQLLAGLGGLKTVREFQIRTHKGL